MGSNISWQKLLKHLRASKCVSCAIVLSLLHQDENVAFQIPRVSVKKELDEAVPFKNSLKSNRMFSNSVGLGEQHQYIFYNFARDSQLIHSQVLIVSLHLCLETPCDRYRHLPVLCYLFNLFELGFSYLIEKFFLILRSMFRICRWRYDHRVQSFVCFNLGNVRKILKLRLLLRFWWQHERYLIC